MRVVFNMDPQGGFEVITDEPCEVFVVCDHAPNDRVYRITEAHVVSRSAVEAALRDDSVGHSGDVRHQAVAHRITSALDGKPFLKPI